MFKLRRTSFYFFLFLKTLKTGHVIDPAIVLSSASQCPGYDPFVICKI